MLGTPLDAAPDPLTDLVDVIDGLQVEDLQLCVGPELGARLTALRTAVNRLEAESARTLEVFDRTQGYASEGALSAASWLRHRCNLSYGSAADQVQLARRLAELPEAQAAFASGEISLTHVSLMSRTVDQIGIEPVREQEAVLVEAARELDPRLFRRVTVHLRHCLDPDGTRFKDASARMRRFVFPPEMPHDLLDVNFAPSICSRRSFGPSSACPSGVGRPHRRGDGDRLPRRLLSPSRCRLRRDRTDTKCPQDSIRFRSRRGHRKGATAGLGWRCGRRHFCSSGTV